MKINEGTAKEYVEGWLKAHHIRHLISGSIVFILCVFTDIYLMEQKHHYLPPRVIERFGPIITPKGTNAWVFKSDGIMYWEPWQQK